MKVKNKKTGEVRDYKEPTLRTIEKDVYECVSRCCGPCNCRIELDGECSKGWPSRAYEYLFRM